MSKTELASDQNLPKDNSEQLAKPIIPNQRNHKKTISRFALLGIFNTILDFFIFNMLRVATHTPSSQINKVIVLNIISATTVATFSFFISRSFVFEQKDTKTHMIIPFIATNLFGIFVLQSLVIKLLLGPLESPAEYLQNLAAVWNLPIIQNFSINFFDTNLAKVFATVVTLVWNYTIYNYVIFKFKPQESTKTASKS